MECEGCGKKNINLRETEDEVFLCKKCYEELVESVSLFENQKEAHDRFEKDCRALIKKKKK